MRTITAVSLWHIDITRLLGSSFEILFPAFNAANSNCCLFCGVSAFTLFFSGWNSCSIGFKSGDWFGQDFPCLCPYKFLDWTGRVFWVIVLMQYEALSDESGGIFLNIGGPPIGFGHQNHLEAKMVLYPSKLILLSFITSSLKLRVPVPETAMHAMPWYPLHHALQMRIMRFYA